MPIVEDLVSHDSYQSIRRVRETKKAFDVLDKHHHSYMENKLEYARAIFDVKLHAHYAEEPLEQTWSEFAQVVLDMHPDHATRMAKWAYVYDVLMSATGSAPRTLYTARPFAKLSPKEMIEAWNDLVDVHGVGDVSYAQARDYIQNM